MLNTIASDLYRITRPHGLRGTFWQYTIAIATVYAAVTATFFFVRSSLFSDEFQTSSTFVTTMTTFETPTSCLASMIGSIIPMCVSFMVVEQALADFKQGFVKSVLTARQGRLSYFAGKILFAGIVSLLMIAVASILVLVWMVVIGATFAHGDTLAGAVSWFAGTWLNIWAISVLSLILVYATRVNPVSYIGAFCFCASVVPQTLTGLAQASDGLLRFLSPIAPVLETLAAWMPSTALSNLDSGGGVINTSIDIWNASNGAIVVNPVLQIILTGVIWIVIASVLVLAICRKRDV